MRVFKIHYTWHTTERTANTTEENPGKEKIMRVWKDYTVGNPWRCHHCYRKSHENHQVQNNKFRWRKLSPDTVPGSKGFRTEPIKETTKEMVDVAKKMWILGKWKVQTNTTPEELTHDNRMRMSASEPVLRFRWGRWKKTNHYEEDGKSSASKQTDIRQSGRRSPITQDLLLTSVMTWTPLGYRSWN